MATNNGKATVEVENAVEEREFTQEQTTNQLRANEEDFLAGLIEAAGFTEDRKKIEIIRPLASGEKKVLFSFMIKPLTESDYNKCKKKHTKYVRNKSLGVKMPEDTDSVRYRDEIIYQATVPEDRKKLWDNKEAWEALRNKGLQILNGLDVIEYTLKAGEKDAIIGQIDKFSAYEDNLEEVTKN